MPYSKYKKTLFDQQNYSHLGYNEPNETTLFRATYKTLCILSMGILDLISELTDETIVLLSILAAKYITSLLLTSLDPVTTTTLLVCKMCSLFLTSL